MTFVEYITLHSITPPPPAVSAGGATFSPKFWKGGIRKKMSARGGGLKEFLPWIFTLGACYVSCQKRLLKIKCGFEGSISNVDLGLF